MATRKGDITIHIEGMEQAIQKDLPAARTKIRHSIGRAVHATADRALGDMQRMIGMSRISAPGQAPGRRSGTYRDSWKKSVHPSGLGGRVYTPSPLAHLLEYGTKNMGARPHAGPLAERIRRPWVTRLKQEAGKL